MKWEGNRESSNVEDLRSGGGGGFGGGMLGGRSIGLGTIAIALVGSLVFGVNPLTVINMLSGGGTATSVQAPTQASHVSSAKPPQDEMGKFVATVLADTEDVWGQLFQQGGSRYVQPKLVLYRGRTATACGTGQAAMGPFIALVTKKCIWI